MNPAAGSSADTDQHRRTDVTQVAVEAAAFEARDKLPIGHTTGTAPWVPVVSRSNSSDSGGGMASAIPCPPPVFEPLGPSPERPAGPFAESVTNGRKADGTFAQGNLVALRHGARSEQVKVAALPEQAEMRAALAARRHEIEADLGGTVSRLSSDMVGRYIELSVVADYLGGRLIADGPLTTKGRQRASLTAYLAVVDRLHRVATALGLERRQKPVNPLEAIHRAAADAIGRPIEDTK